MEASVAGKQFRMSDYIKDGYLAEAVRNEMIDLRGDRLTLAQGAVIEVATSGMPGTFDELRGAYIRAIRRALEPERKLVKNPQIDRKVVKNTKLAETLDRELRDVTQDELNRANAAVKEILDQARDIAVRGGVGEERFATHPPTDICRFGREHSTLPNGDFPGCGYFRDPAEWTDILRRAIRNALAS